MRFLRKNTAVRITVGPFLDVSDAKTPELSLTVTGCHLTMTLDDDDGSAVNLIIDADLTGSGGDNDMVHVTDDNAGYYDLELTQAQTNYNGRVSLCINDDDVHLPVFHEFMILNATVYDALFGSGTLPVDVTAISGDATAANNLETAYDDTAGAVAWQGIIDQGTAQSATGTTVVLRAAAAFANDTLIGTTIAVYGTDQAYWQTRVITDNTLSDDTVTVDTWTVTPTGTITYKIFATPPSSASLLPDVNVEKINNVQVIGAGTSGDKWRA